jgi:hypothetical protein
VAEDHDVMASQGEVLVPVGALHPDGALAEQPALELSARDHVPPPASRIPRARAWTGLIALAAADEEYVIKAVEFLRRIGADDVVLRAVGDRVYECRPALTRPRSRPSRSETGQSP